MKKFALILGLSIALFACHTKKAQDKSGENDPVNLTLGNPDKSVMSSDKPSIKELAEEDATKVDTIASAETTECIDSTKIEKDAACTMDYAPVCGCDGKTYSNKCQAEKSGVTTWTEGECAGDKSHKETEKKDNSKKKGKK